jgi:hypothetical protein
MTFHLVGLGEFVCDQNLWWIPNKSILNCGTFLFNPEYDGGNEVCMYFAQQKNDRKRTVLSIPGT